ncbi:MAG TPA: STAS domain-containing protein [Bryobacteraceae bacterium]|jgi:anti-sigma B factor antagonist|nr:STAS domain-containing protein [Bryobacteraceae bacterium]
MHFRRTNNPTETGDVTLVVGQTASETVVTVTGRVTMESSPYLRSLLFRLLKKLQGATIDIDISGVTYLDTSGIATLVEALKLSQSRSVKLRLVGVGGQPKALAEITELAAVFAATGSEVVFS